VRKKGQLRQVLLCLCISLIDTQYKMSNLNNVFIKYVMCENEEWSKIPT
jgi:hypothetical protein